MADPHEPLSVRETVPMTEAGRLRLRSEALQRGIGHGAYARALLKTAMNHLEADPAYEIEVATAVAAEAARYRKKSHDEHADQTH